MQKMADYDCGLGIVAEPYRAIDDPNWTQCLNGLAAIVRRDTVNSPLLEPMVRGRGFVVAKWGPIVVMSVYLSPRLSLKSVTRRLHILGRNARRYYPCPVIVAGDFNAKSGAWGSPRMDPRGSEVLELAVENGLSLVNQGTENTCVRMRGGSLVDLTWAIHPAQRLMSGWRVMTGAGSETLSDNRYITFLAIPYPREVVERRRLREDSRRR